MWPPAKVNGVWPFNDAWLRTSLSEARRQAPRNVASILDSARELGIRDAQPHRRDRARPQTWWAAADVYGERFGQLAQHVRQVAREAVPSLSIVQARDDSCNNAMVMRHVFPQQ